MSPSDTGRGSRSSGEIVMPLPPRRSYPRSGSRACGEGTAQKRRLREAEPPRRVGALGVADTPPRCDALAARRAAQRERRLIERQAVMRRTGDRERLTNAPGAGAELHEVGQSSARGHDLDPVGRLERADENRRAGLGAADEVETPVNSVAVIDIGVAR